MRSKVEGIGLEGPHMEERRGKHGDLEGEIFPGLKMFKRCLRRRACAVHSDFLSDPLRSPKIALCLMEETNTLQASKIGAAAWATDPVCGSPGSAALQLPSQRPRENLHALQPHVLRPG